MASHVVIRNIYGKVSTLCNMMGEFMSNFMVVKKDINSVDSSLKYIGGNIYNYNEKIDNMEKSINRLESKLDRNNQLLEELIIIMKEK